MAFGPTGFATTLLEEIGGVNVPRLDKTTAPNRVKQESYITPKSGDDLTQTGASVGAQRRDVLDGQIFSSHLNARWVVGRALIQGKEVYYNEDFRRHYPVRVIPDPEKTETINFEEVPISVSIPTRNREFARQVFVLCESGIEGVEKIFVDGEGVNPLTTIENFGDFYRYPGSQNTFISGGKGGSFLDTACDPTTGLVYAAVVNNASTRRSAEL